MNDLVSDALTRIKNGYLAHRSQITLPYSKLVKAICQLLVKEGYITSFKEVSQRTKTNFGTITVDLKYHQQDATTFTRRPALTEVKRISRPGLRIYQGYKFLPKVLNGLGIAIVSTPKGVMTDREARSEGIGGEVLAYVW